MLGKLGACEVVLQAMKRHCHDIGVCIVSTQAIRALCSDNSFASPISPYHITFLVDLLPSMHSSDGSVESNSGTSIRPSSSFEKLNHRPSADTDVKDSESVSSQQVSGNEDTNAV